ncbi:MAG: hypothetical protein ACLPUG_05950 [Acidimicrobiales bacterium]|jgi:hypothetical protein
MPKWEYKLVQWKWLLQYGAPHPADALAKNLNDNGLQGWRLNCQVTLDVGSKQVEYGVFTREIADVFLGAPELPMEEAPGAAMTV